MQNTNSKNNTNKSKVFVKHIWWLDALIFIGGTLLLGGIATLLGGKMFHFEGYEMPPATVPKIVFPFAWGIIYIAIGVSTFLMWRDKEIKENIMHFVTKKDTQNLHLYDEASTMKATNYMAENADKADTYTSNAVELESIQDANKQTKYKGYYKVQLYNKRICKNQTCYSDH